MTGEYLLGMGSALWIGVLTAISPCPLATNVAAISFIGRKVSSPKAVLATGLLYTAGRSLVYVGLAAILVAGLLSAPGISAVLQGYMNKLLGPVLIVVGMFLLGLIRVTTTGSAMGERVGRRVEGWGIWSGLALGVVFALSFCPVSAALYFGSLVPLSVKFESAVVLPLLYGAGTALPVIVFAGVIAFGARTLGRVFDRVAQLERWARRVTGVVFVFVGIYLSLAFVFLVV